MKKLLILFTLSILSLSFLHSQNKSIYGRVISDFIETIPGVSIMINDTIKVGVTDLDGFFQIDIPVTEEKILFISVGHDPAIIELVDKCNEIEVIMMASGTDDFITLKRVERQRKRRFKKLSEVHKQAYEEGLFKTECACFKREFESLFLKN